MSLVGLTALAALAVSQPTHATVMQAVFKGKVTQDLLGTGAEIFGLEQSQLIGSAFTMTFRYDTALGARDVDGQNGAIFGVGDTSPMLSAAVEINGVTRTITGSRASTIRLDVAGADSTSATDPSTGSPGDPLSIPLILAEVVKPGFPLAIDFERAFEIHDGEDKLNSLARLFTFDGDGHILSEVAFGGVSRDLVVSRFQPAAGGVPEPAAWALMVGGFGMMGASLRRRGRLNPARSA